MGIFDRLFGKKSLQSVHSNQGWTSLFVHEPYSGAWQKNDELTREDLAAHHAVFSCVSLISQDIGKMPILLKKKKDGVWIDQEVPDQFKVLKKPNHYQTWQQFSEQWTTSLLLRGNSYVIKIRDIFSGRVVGLKVLNPDLTKPLISDAGDVFYQLNDDRLNQTSHEVVPASEIIHDRINCFYHPLVGLSPITACAVAAGHGLEIQKSQRQHFKNNSRPGGILIAPGPISKEKAQEVKQQWNENYGGVNAGCTAVVGDGLDFKAISVSAADSQLIEQMRMSNEVICAVFHVPQFKLGIGTIPAGQKVSDLNEIYYSDCLQSLIESRENLLDESLGLKDANLEAFLDLDTLIRMDSVSQMQRLKEGVGAAIMTPNEARQKLGLGPLEGGDTVYMQQQNYSLEALSKRDQLEDPFTARSSQVVTDGLKSSSGNLQQEALNGAQVTALQGIMNAVAFQGLPPESAKNLISIAFPLVSAEQIEAMLKPVIDAKEDMVAEPKKDDKPDEKALWQGVFKAENQYKSGQFVTHKGSLWHCEKDHSGEFSHENFKLAQKKWGEE